MGIFKEEITLENIVDRGLAERGMELEDAVTAAGHEVIGGATGLASAIALATARLPDIPVNCSGSLPIWR